MIVREKSAIADLAKLCDQTSLDTLRLWQVFHVADDASPYLTHAMVDSQFAFARTLSGVDQIKPRWKRGLELVNASWANWPARPMSPNTSRPKPRRRCRIWWPTCARLSSCGSRPILDGTGHQAGRPRQAGENRRHGRLSRCLAQL
jgi:hypothetical protein